MLSRSDDEGVSPILAVLLMIAITLMIAGIISLWVFSFINEEHEAGDMFLFEVELDSLTDTITITTLNGNIVSTSNFQVIINNTNIPVGSGPLNTGEPYVLNCGFDVIKGQKYNIKMVNNNKMIFEQDHIAL